MVWPQCRPCGVFGGWVAQLPGGPFSIGRRTFPFRPVQKPVERDPRSPFEGALRAFPAALPARPRQVAPPACWPAPGHGGRRPGRPTARAGESHASRPAVRAATSAPRVWSACAAARLQTPLPASWDRSIQPAIPGASRRGAGSSPGRAARSRRQAAKSSGPGAKSGTTTAPPPWAAGPDSRDGRCLGRCAGLLHAGRAPGRPRNRRSA